MKGGRWAQTLWQGENRSQPLLGRGTCLSCCYSPGEPSPDLVPGPAQGSKLSLGAPVPDVASRGTPGFNSLQTLHLQRKTVPRGPWELRGALESCNT